MVKKSCSNCRGCTRHGLKKGEHWELGEKACTDWKAKGEPKPLDRKESARGGNDGSEPPISDIPARAAVLPSGLIEKLAALEHEQWLKWSRTLILTENLTPERVVRWDKLNVPYEKLSDHDKITDREWALKVAEVVAAWHEKELHKHIDEIAKVNDDFIHEFERMYKEIESLKSDKERMAATYNKALGELRKEGR